MRKPAFRRDMVPASRRKVIAFLNSSLCARERISYKSVSRLRGVHFMTGPISSDDDRDVGELLSQWESSPPADRPRVEELCQRHPHLVERVREAIDKLGRADRALGADTPPTRPLDASPVEQ